MNNETKGPIIIDIEACAISEIVRVLDGLADDRKQAVLRFLLQRFGAGNTGNVGSNQFFSNENEDEADSAKSIKVFLKEKNPQTLYQHVAVLAYFLRKNRNEEEVDTESIEAANREAGGRTIDQVGNVLKDAKNKYGFFRDGTGKKKVLLALAEDVVEALPDQEKVKGLTKGKIRRSKRKNKKEAAVSEEN